jgi:hypothetical protein
VYKGHLLAHSFHQLIYCVEYFNPSFYITSLDVADLFDPCPRAEIRRDRFALRSAWTSDFRNVYTKTLLVCFEGLGLPGDL